MDAVAQRPAQLRAVPRGQPGLARCPHPSQQGAGVQLAHTPSGPGTQTGLVRDHRPQVTKSLPRGPLGNLRKHKNLVG